MLYIDKILSQLIYPLSLSLLLVVMALLLVLFNRRWWGVGLLAFAVGWLGFWASPPMADAVRLSLEARYPQLHAQASPEAEVIVVLGGAVSPRSKGWPYSDLGAAADRVLHAARLYHAGKAPLVIVSGGTLPWLDADESEAEAMQRFLVDLGVPEEAVLLESHSTNTRENAVFSGKILHERGLERVLLVTSALHMRRAVASFRAVGIDVIPATTDFEVVPRRHGLLRTMPDAGALEGSTRAFKEYVGFWVYRFRGWAS